MTQRSVGISPRGAGSIPGIEVAPTRTPARASSVTGYFLLKSRSVSSWSTPPTTGILVLGSPGGNVATT